MATITFGDTNNPSAITKYLDSVFAQSLENYGKSIVDNIGKRLAIFDKLVKSNLYEGESGGTNINLPLMYQLATMDSYDGYDELSTAPTDGVTAAIYEWRQQAVPIVYSMKEVIQNREKIIDLVKTRIMQSEMGLQEGFATHFLQGSGTGALSTPKVSAVNGSSSIEPLPKLVEYNPSSWASSTTVGNISPITESWWRNYATQSAATTYDGLLKEFDTMYNNTSRGTGGACDLIWCDQTTYELLTFAIYARYRQINSDNSFPFENIKFKKAVITWDELIPDVANNTISTATKGTAYFLNTKFFRAKYINGRDFKMLKDENGNSFAKPLNGDSRVGHIAWMGNFCVNNRRKHGVLGNIARTLT